MALYSFSKTPSKRPILLYRRTDRILDESKLSAKELHRWIYPDTVLALKVATCSSVCSLNSLLLMHLLPQMEVLEVSLVQISRFLICSLWNLMWSDKSAAEGNFSTQLSSKWHLNPSCKSYKYHSSWFTSNVDLKESIQVHPPPTFSHNWLDGAQQFWLASRCTFPNTKLITMHQH